MKLHYRLKGKVDDEHVEELAQTVAHLIVWGARRCLEEGGGVNCGETFFIGGRRCEFSVSANKGKKKPLTGVKGSRT